MIAVDTNILVHAHRSDSPFHTAALQCMEGLVEGSARWALPWPCVHEFVAVVTHPRIWRPPSPLTLAFDALRAWLASPMAELIGEGPDHLTVLADLANSASVAGPQIHDTRIAAICKQHAVRELLTADRDFSRYPTVRCRNPLVQ